MPLDFPANPVNGQAYGAYIYNASVGAWQAKEDPATVATVSTVAPTSGNPGDIWYDSDDGTTYIYYDDGNSGQWVELLSSGVPLLNTKADLAGATFTGNVTAPRFISSQAIGTAPFQVASTTVVSNLNADLLDGQHGSVYSPAGMISQFAGSTAPTGWLICNGAAISRTEYSELFAVIGSTYGGGDGSTTFNLPNLENRVPVGKGADVEFNTLGETGGAKTITLTAAQIPAHSHPNTLGGTTSFATATHTHAAGTMSAAIGATNGNIGAVGYVASNNFNGGPGTATYTVSGGGAVGGSFNHYTNIYGSTNAASASASVTITNANNTGGGGAHDNLQPYIVLNYIIKT